MKLVIDQELAQQCLNAIAKLPYQDVFQIVPKLLQLPILTEAPVAEPSSQASEIAAEVQEAATAVAQEITASN